MSRQSRGAEALCHRNRVRVRCPAQERRVRNPPAQPCAAAAARSRCHGDWRCCSAARTTRFLPRKARRSLQSVQLMPPVRRQPVLSAARRVTAHWSRADPVHRSPLSLSSHLRRASRLSCRKRSCSRHKLSSARRLLLVSQRTALLSQQSSNLCSHVPAVLSSRLTASAEQQHQQTRSLSSQAWKLRQQSGLPMESLHLLRMLL